MRPGQKYKQHNWTDSLNLGRKGLGVEPDPDPPGMTKSPRTEDEERRRLIDLLLDLRADADGLREVWE